jgi:hypothetical protein
MFFTFTNIYDKRDDFNFKIINFPNMCSNIPASPAYGVYISQFTKLSEANVKKILRHIDKKNIFDIFVDFLIFIHFRYMKIHRLLSSLQRRNIFRQDLGIPTCRKSLTNFIVYLEFYKWLLHWKVSWLVVHYY